MGKTKLILLVAISIAVVFSFTSCGEVSDDEGGSRSSPSSGGGSSGSRPPSSTISCTRGYDDLTHFCFGEYVYERCGGEKYDPLKRFCFENKFYLICGNVEYNPLAEFCSNGNVHLRCDGKELNPNDEFCFGGSRIVPFCGTEAFNPDEEFCVKNVVTGSEALRKKCGGNEFYPSEEFCSDNNKLYPICEGDSTYNTSLITCCGGKKMTLGNNKFCFDGQILDKCGSREYDPITQVCGDGNVYQRKTHSICRSEAGDNAYEHAEKFCFPGPIDGTIFDKCESNQKTFNGNDEFCDDIEDKIIKKCGGFSYATGDYFCLNNEVTSLCGPNKKTYDDKQFCDDNGDVYPKCEKNDINPNGIIYTTSAQYCYRNKLYSKTGCLPPANNKPYDFCDDGKNYAICGEQRYDIDKQFCHNSSVVRELCGINKEEYDPVESFCSPRGEVTLFCQVASPPDPFTGMIIYTPTAYDTDNQACENNAVVSRGFKQRCATKEQRDPATGNIIRVDYVNDNGVIMGNTTTHFCCFGTVHPKNSDSFCYDDELYNRCGRTYPYKPDPMKPEVEPPYNPRDSLCFQPGTAATALKANCSNDGITGPCAYSNSLLRCKQLGNGSDYIIDPLPGMMCLPNGAILGNGIQNNVGYPIAQIGKQIWTTENLKANLEGSRSYNATYGRVYDWAVAMNLPPDECNFTSQGCPPSSENTWKGICPKGFDIPKVEDWDALAVYAGGAKVAAGRLKAKAADGWNGTDDYGFKALPGGYDVYWNTSYTYHEQSRRSIWWTYDQKQGDEAYYFDMISDDSELRTHYRPKDGGAYVRCVRYGAF